MKNPDCCLVLVFPKSLEDDIVDHLLDHPELASGFTTIEVEGHGAGSVYRSMLEQVRGRTRKVRMEVVMERTDASALVAHFKETLPSTEVAYWVLPVLDFGRFA